jgi:ATP-dependent Clp protease adaptor protein ClpS
MDSSGVGGVKPVSAELERLAVEAIPNQVPGALLWHLLGETPGRTLLAGTRYLVFAMGGDPPSGPSRRGKIVLMATAPTVRPPAQKPREQGPGDGPGMGDPVSVIVLNDNHNTFEGVAAILARYIPGVDYDRGIALANKIHNAGSARVWSGDRERAELYWEQLRDAGLTMAPLA